jgi:SulP family sulfate permease
VLLVMTAVNAIDMTALERLTELDHLLAARGIRLHFSDLKGPIADRLRDSELLAHLSGRVYRFTHEAFDDLVGAGGMAIGSDSPA